jgi:hypothetical protein
MGIQAPWLSTKVRHKILRETRGACRHALPLILSVTGELCVVCYSIHAAGLNAAPKHQIGASHPAVSSARTETVRGGRPDEKVTVIPARLIHMVQPKYPKAAERAGVHGTVVLDIVIGIDGHARDIQYVSGPKALADSAINASGNGAIL